MTPRKAPLFRHLMPIAGWVFMGVWLSMLSLFTWLFLRDGGFHQFPAEIELGIMGLFWLFGIGGGGQFFDLPIVWLKMDGNYLRVRRQWLLTAKTTMIPLDAVPSPILRESRDESEPYFHCVLTLSEGDSVVFSEHRDRQDAENALAHFRDAVSQGQV
ncbi:hypothetical protein PQU92_03565 [Asticcacaulis sp. BYS171W]|uniref:DUF2244 domain-containing protein n=1 Tax=Asticcacaulis aquaticus TaxID=2984212 RepID=A0ABT5HQJ2_9CAUL|nr:hypothetical protein [Asticcacaulis aquaticus]MDC7682337.1 hypothetical protein [Asticcacaulis aquaticus]